MGIRYGFLTKIEDENWTKDLAKYIKEKNKNLRDDLWSDGALNKKPGKNTAKSTGLDAFGFAGRDLAFEEEVLNVGKLDKFDSFENSPGKELDLSEELIISSNILGSDLEGKKAENAKDSIFGSMEIEEEQVISSHKFSSGFNSESEAFSNTDDVFS